MKIARSTLSPALRIVSHSEAFQKTPCTKKWRLSSSRFEQVRSLDLSQDRSRRSHRALSIRNPKVRIEISFQVVLTVGEQLGCELIQRLAWCIDNHQIVTFYTGDNLAVLC